MPENINHYCACRAKVEHDLGAAKPLKLYKAVVLKNSRWEPATSITIRFLDGDRALQQRVKQVANEWLQIANLHFDWRISGPTEIRISFSQGNGSWSSLGTDCHSTQEPKPTMNYGWLAPDSPDTELRGVVLHEFGHAIGLIHEHQNPKGGIKWNRSAVIHDLSGLPNQWDEETIEANVFHFYPLSSVVATDVDPASIMMYPIPRAWTLDGFSSGLNGELSDIDKTLIQNVYPF